MTNKYYSDYLPELQTIRQAQVGLEINNVVYMINTYSLPCLEISYLAYQINSYSISTISR